MNTILRLSLLGILIFILPLRASSQNSSIYQIASVAGNYYLKALSEIESFEADNRLKKMNKHTFIFNYAGFLSPNSTFDSLLSTQRFRFQADSLRNIIRNHSIKGLPAIRKALRNEIQNRNLVMISEHHFYPNHRSFVDSLLPMFAESGFRYLSIETLSENADSLLNAGHPVSTDMGFYTRDPRFANVLRRARELGFTLVSHENTDRTKDRELGQAENIYNSTFANDPKAKVLVLAGMDHILEKPTKRGKKWLAAVLRDNYDLDPLTINQHHLRYFENTIEETALINSEYFENTLLQSVDYHIINSIQLSDVDKNYSYQNRHDKRVQLSIFNRKNSLRDGSFGNIVPFKTQLLERSQIAAFQLPRGNFDIFVHDDSGQIIENLSFSN